MPRIDADDIILYIYKDSEPPARSLRLSECARRYAASSGLPAVHDRLATAPGGKPYFLRQPGLHFSISHSGDYWAVAFGGQPVGLDIQQHAARDYLALAKRWYHPQEYAAVQQYGPAHFFAIWSAKESVVKCSGKGIFASFSTFSVAEGSGILPLSAGLQVRPVSLMKGYAACLCAKRIKRVYLEW